MRWVSSGTLAVSVLVILAMSGRGRAQQPDGDTTAPDGDSAQAIESPPAEGDGSATSGAETPVPAPEEPPVELEVPEEESSAMEYLRETTSVHGFGTWSGGWTRARHGTENQYEFGGSPLEVDHAVFALREFYQPTPEIRLAAGQSFTLDEADIAVELDIAGAQWTPKPWFAFRVGRVLNPIGIYTETFRVGTLRPFGALPNSIYGGAGFIAQSYDGAEVAFSLDTESGWEARLTTFSGYTYIQQDPGVARTIEALSGGVYPIHTFSNRVTMDLFGGAHVRVDTPINGLGFAVGTMASSARFTRHDEFNESGYGNLVIVGSLWLLRDAFELRAEAAYRRNYDRSASRLVQSTRGAYVEAAFRPIEKLQLAIRLEHFDQHTPSIDFGAYGAIRRSNDIGGVVSWWFAPGFVIKAEYHFVEGNRFAHPEGDEMFDAVSANERMYSRTHFIGVNSAFSF